MRQRHSGRPVPRVPIPATSGSPGGREAGRRCGSITSLQTASSPASSVPRGCVSESISEAVTTTWQLRSVMASIWESIVGFLDSIGRNPAYLMLFLGFILLLIIALVVHHIRKIRNQDIWVHQAWGAKWKGR